jgi:glyoxylase-like metal-dependent hydrolase (beta-lactamase superfamily II)
MRYRPVHRAALAMLLVGVCGALTLFGAALQPPQPAGVKVPDIDKVRDNLYVIGGANPNRQPEFSGGNTAVFVTTRGVVVVDTKFAGWGRMILDKIRSVTDKPVTTIINTHTHFDHSGSNTEFPATIEFVAHENTRANMARATCEPVTNCAAFKGENAKFLPKRTFADKLSLFSGADQIDLYHFGRGHTNGDAFVVFKAARAVHTGDMYQLKWLPFIDPSSGGSVLTFPKTLARAVAEIKNVDTVIPGHSPATTWPVLKEHVEVLEHFVAAAQAGLKAGRSAEDVAKAYKIPERFKDYLQDQERNLLLVKMVYDEMGRPGQAPQRRP